MLNHSAKDKKPAEPSFSIAEGRGHVRLRIIGALAGGVVVSAALVTFQPRLGETLLLTGVGALLAWQSARVRGWFGRMPPEPQTLPASPSPEQARLEGIIRSAMEAIITVDESQKILIFNPMAEKLFGCASVDAIGGSLERFMPMRFRAGHANKVKQFGITGITERQMGQQRPLYGLRANGEEFPAEASISQLVEGNSRLYTVMLRDVTDRVRAEEALKESRNELQQLSANIQTAREEEKARIARELHDDLGQRLTALKMDLSLLESELTGHEGSHDWSDQTRAMQRLIDDTVSAVRAIAADLRPIMLDDLGLLAAIDWLANEWRSRYGIVVRVSAPETAWRFKRDAATAVFRIVQEALTNIARHANATRATVSFNCNPAKDLCVVRIADNGTGMAHGKGDVAGATGAGWPAPRPGGESPATAHAPASTTDAPPRQPFGLLGMRERARLLGGDLVIESPMGGGLIVTVSIPLAVNEAAPAPHGATLEGN